MGQLYIVSTPIGNRRDITLRALEILKQTEILLCEDTRKTKQLLDFYQIEAPQLVSFYEPVEEAKIPQVIAWLKAGKTISLVSNAGTPLISDPGFKLVRECRHEKITVIPIPGASAILAGLVISGLPTDKFMFLGFLPKKQGKKEKMIRSIVEQTTIMYESPFRLIKTLGLINKIIPQAQVVVARELTKKFEESFSGTPLEVLDQLKDRSVKGEVVILLSQTYKESPRRDIIK